MVVLDNEGNSDFQQLQNALKVDGSTFIYYIFNLMYYDKYDLSDSPLIERKTLLQILLQKTNLRFSNTAIISLLMLKQCSIILVN